MKTRSTLMVCILTLTALPAFAQIDWSDDPAEWPRIKEEKGKVSKGLIDFDDDPPYPIQSFPGPLTHKGAGPVSPGVVLENVIIDNVNPYGNGLGSWGPHSRWANPSNGIAANYFGDTLEIYLIEPNHTMVAINHWMISGDGDVDVSFYDKQDNLIGMVPGVAAPESGHTVLYWTKDRSQTISRISIFDSGGGAEAIMQTEYFIPEPVTLSLLALGALAALRRRR